ncbi:phosphoadenosine phosphosulfate reductase family protein [Roseobacter sp. HKCCA0434]|uniref:phosphoadenosine phosphosulfate reductase family protein n=1 Tax=Roseobacter sp. HKCCA0434 TaxID=3079297 RepID=UPI002905E12C|nr:phosphoadenosine phosphosulfate reductase family protein [Roseobacter sp. HKCCA0434]
MIQHIVNISGGKDSAACYLLALHRGVPFRAVMADTGHEAPETYEWVARLPERTGGPKVELVRAEFASRFAAKRRTIATRWRANGIAEVRIERALDLLHPTGIPFLDLCMIKGRFPSVKARFCTEELKAIPIDTQIVRPARLRSGVIRWQGERCDESPARRGLPRTHIVRERGLHRMVLYRPIRAWSRSNVFELHRLFGLDPNPLYARGFDRVGCFPCIMESKKGLSVLARHHPEAVARPGVGGAGSRCLEARGHDFLRPQDHPARP